MKDVGQIAETTADAILRDVIRLEVSREEVASAVTAVRS